MTKTSKAWRVKRLKRIRVINKIHNLILAIIAGIMTVFFLLSLCAIEVNKQVLLMFAISTIYLMLFCKANNLFSVEAGEE